MNNKILKIKKFKKIVNKIKKNKILKNKILKNKILKKKIKKRLKI